ncbi:PREDICTED: putative UDP-sugar transporter DDB_G0278631 [Camelina sativa]|uniref:UDP-sugar transporter DDB_G0278631 n=1 Tax=Camelina sativa TaxID=90675 RepID=A0ABM0Y7J3_CAMSA|nr:PREDICTED: putative UDP-sugar transporter DDB_G0278631 [Camelina sativa]
MSPEKKMVAIVVDPSMKDVSIGEEDTKKVRPSSSSGISSRGVFAAISYMASAVLLVIFNKAALSSYRFQSANVITLFQMLSSCLFLYVMRYFKFISFNNDGLKSEHNNKSLFTLVTTRRLFQTIPLAFTYLFYMLVTMESVRNINVPMYTTLRRTTILFTMIMEYFLTGQKHSASIIFSVGIIILGAIIAGIRDLSFDGYGYGLVFTANICTATYLALIARIGKSSGLNIFGLMWCNGIICIPFLLLWTSVKGELEAMLSFPHLYSLGFQVVICLSCMLAFLINYSVFLNTTLNSALTHSICGNLKDLFTIALGWLIFAGLPFDWVNVMGQALGFTGSIVYAFFKYKGI